MSAATQWQNLDPAGAGHDLLCQWAGWMREDAEGGSASWATHPRIDRGHHGTPPDLVMAVDRIVARMKTENPPYWRVVARYYLDQLQPWQISKHLAVTQGWVRTMLLAACGLVEIRYNELDLPHKP